MLIRSHAVDCATNLRQLGMATIMYAGDHSFSLPLTTHQRRAGGLSWTLSLQPYASGTVTFKCADDEDSQRPYTYLINDFLTPNPAGAPDLDFSRISKVQRPEKTFLFAEASATYRNSDHFHFSEYHRKVIPSAVFAAQVAVQRHGGKSNYLFTDGHVETLSWKEVQIRLNNAGSQFVDPTGPQ